MVAFPKMWFAMCMCEPGHNRLKVSVCLIAVMIDLAAIPESITLCLSMCVCVYVINAHF